MINRCSFILLLLSCISSNSFSSVIWKLQNVEYKVDTLSHVVIGPGTTQTTLALEGPVKLRVFYTTTDMTVPNVNLKLIMGKDNLTSNVTVPNMPASHIDSKNIYFAGVNADFIGGMGPVGTTIVNGEFYKSYKGTGWYAVGISQDKKLCSGAPYTTFKLVSPNAGQMSIKAINGVRSDNELILYTSRKGSSTGTNGTGVEVGAVSVDGPLKSEGTTRMRVTIAPVKNIGNMSIPAQGFVLSGTGFTADMIGKMQLGEEFEVTPTIYFDNIVKTDITEMCGGCPMLLQSGKILETQGLLDHLPNREPRTAIGYNSDGTKAILLVVDGRQAGISVGVPSKDLAAIMLNLGCTEALNFDGGGSSTLYVKELGVINTPSEGSLRAVKNGLFITTPFTEDKEIVKIRFADYAKKVEYNTLYSPVIYGYNAQGVLINTKVEGIKLSCDAELGEVQEDSTTVLCNGVGPHTLTASLGELTSVIQVTVQKNPGSGILSTTNRNSVNVYPNPIRAGELAYVHLNERAEISIYNSAGKLINNFKCENIGSASITLPTESLIPGFYLISILDDRSNRIAKMIIK
ncbi:phosphodiester glycosidase family protein [Bacteroides sedimenti]|uniref:phosphodiester glycosidase family protein n=1 Tax=Bacteroides sedimenti TaxID=2136147 RepID=UPI0033407F8C